MSRLAIRFACLLLGLWGTPVIAAVSLYANGQTAPPGPPVVVYVGQVVNFEAVVTGCPGAPGAFTRQWRQTWDFDDGTVVTENLGTQSPCARSPVTRTHTYTAQANNIRPTYAYESRLCNAGGCGGWTPGDSDFMRVRVLAPPAGLAAFDISVGANANTCTSTPVTLTALDAAGATDTTYTGTITLTTNTNHGDWFVNAAGGTLNNGAPDDGAASYGFVAADNGQIVLNLKNSHAEDLSITVQDTAAGISAVSTVVAFRDNAFLITPSTATAGVPDSTELVAARPHGFFIEAWERNPADPTDAACQIASTYAGTRTIKFSRSLDALDPNGAAPTIGGGAVPTAGTVSVNITFSAGVGAFVLNTTDVGKFSLNALDDSASFASVNILGSSPVLTVRPLALGVTNIRRGAVINPGGVAADTGNAFIAAGETFQATLGAYRWSAADDADNDGLQDPGTDVTDNGLTPSYAWQTALAADTVPGRFTPLGAPAPGGLGGSLPLAQAGFAGGAQTINDLRYDEVGSLRIDARADNYLNSALTLGGQSPVVGRFFPHHFALLNPSITPFCNGFTYMNQTALGVSYTLEARNLAGNRTLNYFLDNTSPATQAQGYANAVPPTHVAEDNNDGTDRGGRVSLIAIPDWSAGQIIINDPMAAFARDLTPDGPYDNLQIGVQVLDPDGARLENPDMKADDTADCATAATCNARSLGTTRQRYGRLALINAHGPEVQPLPVPLLAEYYTANAFVQNTLDTCTAPTLPVHLRLCSVLPCNPLSANWQTGDTAMPVGGGTSTAALANSPLLNGDAGLSFSAPGANNTGYIDIRAVLSNSPAQVTDMPWLEYAWGFDWDEDGTPEETGPAGRVTFGIYGSEQRQIYMRELF